LWTWDAVELDCAGGAETVASYEILAAVALPFVCLGEDGEEETCYTRSAFSGLASVAAPATSWPDVSSPPILGGITYYLIRARDLAGNPSDACQPLPW